MKFQAVTLIINDRPFLKTTSTFDRPSSFVPLNVHFRPEVWQLHVTDCKLLTKKSNSQVFVSYSIPHHCLASNGGFFEFLWTGWISFWLFPVILFVRRLLLRLQPWLLLDISVSSSGSSVKTALNGWFDVDLHRWFIHELSWSFSLIIFPNEWLHEINFLAW